MKKAEMATAYQEAREFLKNKQADQARPLLTRIYQQKADYQSVAYYLGKACYRLKSYAKATRYLKKYLQQQKKTNRGQAYRLLAHAAIQQNQLEDAQEYIQAAGHAGMAPEKLAKVTAALERQQKKVAEKKAHLAELKERGYAQLSFQFIKLAKNGTPIAKAEGSKYQGKYFFINGMTVKKQRAFADGEWHELDVTLPKPADFPGYLVVSVTDLRTYYKDIIPKLKELRYRSAINDWMEDDPFFAQRWEKSRVFSLLLLPSFDKEEIEQVLLEYDLLDTKAQEHLQSCDDLIMLKSLGETMPVAQSHLISNLDLLRDFGYICPDNCNNTLHLREKCAGERYLRELLAEDGCPVHHLKKSFGSFKPTAEQQRFIAWLKKSDRRVDALLGVGGSGKTYTLGKIFNTRKVLALAPTHKARINLILNGFTNAQTIQKLGFDIDNGFDDSNFFHEYGDFDTIIIDEISMVTQDILVKLMQTFGHGVRYLFLGDDRQLPPVTNDTEALAVAGNVMELLQKKGHAFYFQDNIRCQDPQTKNFIASCRAKSWDGISGAPRYFHETLKEMLRYKKDHIDISECMILAYRNYNVAQINQAFFKVLARDKQNVVPFEIDNNKGRGGFFVGAQVVFYENGWAGKNYTNSEFGVVTSVSLPTERSQGEIKVKTDLNEYKLPLKKAKKDLLLAYAITIHKAQGSGADKVYVVETGNYGLAYTAVSRSKGALSFVNMSEQQLLDSLERPAAVKQNVYV
ncbi:MAG TPA: AAA family ATPase [Candidatus Ligilactobacillus excrementipullorum]|nr:AAA family ATPase [Candidatus Ligilactobacillus excrementipullorum]